MKDSSFYLPVTVLAPLAQLPLRAWALPGHLLLAYVRPVSGGDCPSPCASGSSAPPAKGGSLERTGTGTAPPRPRCPWHVGSQQPPGAKTSPPVSPAGPALLSSCRAGVGPGPRSHLHLVIVAAAAALSFRPLPRLPFLPRSSSYGPLLTSALSSHWADV